MSRSPAVLVLLATYNGARYLRQQLASIENQSYTGWHLLMSDDGSTDETRDLLREFRDRHPDKVSELDCPPSGSPQANFFGLLRAAKGFRYVALCDQDDVWVEHRLESLLRECQKLEASSRSESPCMVFSDLRVVDENLYPISESFFRDMSVDPSRMSFGSTLVESSVPGCSMMVNEALLLVFQRYSGPLNAARMHDWWLSLIAQAFGSSKVIDEPLVQYRQHASNSAGSTRRRGVSFILSKLRQRPRDEMLLNVAQGRLFLEAYGAELAPAELRQLEILDQLSTLSKLRRIEACIKFGILKQGLLRRGYQLWYI